MREVPTLTDDLDSKESVAPGTDVYVVYDLSGAGRLVGVFSDARRATRIVAVNPAYYRSTRCRLDRVTEAALEWLDSPEQRDKLEKLHDLR